MDLEMKPAICLFVFLMKDVPQLCDSCDDAVSYHSRDIS